MKTKINIENWNRREQFQFFKQYQEPFWGVTVEVDCTKAYAICKENNDSFFFYYLHKMLCASNQVENFCYRLSGDEVYLFTENHASATINRADDTFGFSFIRFRQNFQQFTEGGKKEVERVRNSTALFPPELSENVLHISALPWLRFTSLSHARSFSGADSCPKISIGQLRQHNGRYTMPISIHVHHALVDGLHVGQFVTIFEDLMNENA